MSSGVQDMGNGNAPGSTTSAEAGTAAALLATLVEAAHDDERRLGTLDRLRRACDHFAGEGRRFSLRDVEAHCRSIFGAGPRAQTISNDAGLHAYVEARRREVAFPRRRRSAGTLDSGVEEIPDPDLRARMRALVEEHRLLRERHRVLIRGLACLSPPLDLDAVLCGAGHGNFLPTEGRPAEINHEQVQALRELVSVLRDPACLSRIGLEVDGGDVVGRGMRETLIEESKLKLLEALVERWKGSRT